MKNLHIISLGCAKNQVDAEVMAAHLEEGGYHLVSDPRMAAIILVNTCAFILPAKEESIEEILRAAAWKKTGRCRYLVVTGCLSQRYGKSLLPELPEVDIFLDINEIPHIAKHLDRLSEQENPAPSAIVSNPSFLMDAGQARRLFTPPHTAYLKIADGCTNFCSYCIIPALRGKARSRTPEDILIEAENLAAKGVREIILTAQDTTAYGRDLKGRHSLGELLKKLSGIKALRWIRLLYTYPGKLDAATLTVMAEAENICSYLDIPVQHIDNDILQAMRRRGDSAQIRESIALIRRILPDAALRTSLIVGFPGETPARFKRLVDFIVATKFDHLGVFTYSREEETSAAMLTGHITEKTKERRRRLLMEEQAVISSAVNHALIGASQEVLIEGASDIPAYPYLGRCRRQAPDIDGVTYIKGEGLKTGDFVAAKITAADTYDLYAEASK